MAYNVFDVMISTPRYQDWHISHKICLCKSSYVNPLKAGIVPSSGPAVASLIECNDLVASFAREGMIFRQE